MKPLALRLTFAAAALSVVSPAFAKSPAHSLASAKAPSILRTNNQFVDKYFPPILTSLPDPARNQTIVIGAETFLDRRPSNPSDLPAYGLYAINDLTGQLQPWRPRVFHHVGGVSQNLHQSIYRERTKAIIIGDSLYVSTLFELDGKFESQIFRVSLNNETFEPLLNNFPFQYITDLQEHNGRLIFSYDDGYHSEKGGLGSYDPALRTITTSLLTEPHEINGFVVVGDVALTCITAYNSAPNRLQSFDLITGKPIAWGPTPPADQGCGDFQIAGSKIFISFYGQSFYGPNGDQLLVWDPSSGAESWISYMPRRWNMRVIGDWLYYAGDDNVSLFSAEVRRIHRTSLQMEYVTHGNMLRLKEGQGDVLGIVGPIGSGSVPNEIYVHGSFQLSDGTYSNLMRLPVLP